MAIVGSLAINVTAATADFQKGMQRVKLDLQVTQQAVQQTQSAFAGLTKSFAGLAAGAVSIGAITASIRDVVKTGQDMERLRSAFTAITGSVAAGRQEFQFVSAQANKLGIDTAQLADSYRSLTAATRGTVLAGTDTRELFINLTNASKAYGLSTEQTGRALTALEQIVSKGKVSQEELRGEELAPLAA